METRAGAGADMTLYNPHRVWAGTSPVPVPPLVSPLHLKEAGSRHIDQCDIAVHEKGDVEEVKVDQGANTVQFI